ncbi:glycosyltransferase family 2 protein [Nitrospirillum bahiense]|uniref:Glycosyl transferase family 2 n=1 Tax=Nitrospirillum amazonense TaxID=28077 RepID=A0A560FTW6_9PROT|nr:glycosyltransferase family 2 protein [Nitrospirillum amazonense]TWB25073.1 glycosyl transferase family 2 [Nitrospirillum amazonense]
MSLSVVIPLYNKEDYIEEALASLARQTHLPHEVIVVDDASTDDGAARAESGLRRLAQRGVARTELLRLPVNGGPSAARNRGLERAAGTVLAFLDADDRWRDDCCSEILRCMQGHALELLVLGFDAPSHGDYFPDMDALRDEVVPLEGALHRLPRVTASASHLDFFMGRASNVAVRRGAIGEERFVEGRHVNENIDFWYRVAKSIVKGGGATVPVGLLAEPVIRYRILPDSLSHRRCQDWRQLQIPPSLERFRHSDDADDRRLCRTLGRRWLTFAMESLPDQAQRDAFCGAHGALLTHFDIDLPLLWRAA